MSILELARRRLFAGILGLAALFGPVIGHAVDLKVVSSGGFAAAYKTLAPQFEAQSGNTLTAEWGPSMGDTPGAIPNRLARGESIDVVIMVSDALDRLISQGQVLADEHRVLAYAKIGMAVRAGAARPDISSTEALKRTLLAARSIAYSDSASGMYLQNVLFPKLGIAEALKGRAHMIPAEPVGQVVARGDAEIGFQQMSELKAVSGIDIVGPIPEDVQLLTPFSIGIVARSQHADAARALIRFLSAPAARPAIEASGMAAADSH